jgi:Holliday junction resolvase RusA-like endonuclease
MTLELRDVGINTQNRVRFYNNHTYYNESYNLFRKEFEIQMVDQISDDFLTFESFDDLKIFIYIKMPKSWSDKKKKSMVGTKHKVKPDGDNMLKSILDCLVMCNILKDDKAVPDFTVRKRWSYEDLTVIKINEGENHE